MNMPFNADQFFRVFESYNSYWFPGQVIILLMALIAFFLTFGKTGNQRLVAGFLGFLWKWNGIFW